MQRTKEQTYTIQEVKESVDRYLNSSAERLRARLKNSWEKQLTARQLTHAETKI